MLLSGGTFLPAFPRRRGQADSITQKRGITVKQLNHYETMRIIRPCHSELVLCLCGVTCENFGLILRTADVFSVGRIIYLGREPENERKFQKISRGAAVQVEFTRDTGFIDALRGDGYKVYALEITDQSVPLRTFSFPAKTCLIVGNERHGVPEELLTLADGACYIEMYGANISSLNVSVSTAIAVNRYMEYNFGGAK